LNIRCLIYIDDLLILDQDRVRLAKAMGIAMQLLQKECGLQLKISKGQLSPQQQFQCLGFTWDTKTMQVRVPPKLGFGSVLDDGRGGQDSAAHGTGVHTRPGPFRRPGRLDEPRHQAGQTTAAIHAARLSQGGATGGWNGFATLTPEVRRALLWWTTDDAWKSNGDDIVPPTKEFHCHLRTDAATNNAGYGGVLTYMGKKFRTQGCLTRAEQDEVWINEFEFSGFELSLKALLPQAIPDRALWTKVHVTVELDNTAAIHYGKVAVSRSLKLSEKGAAFFDWKERHGLSVSLTHLAGEQNIEADGLSRRQSTHIDWRMSVWLFKRMHLHFKVKLKVDLFASAQNTQLPGFFAFHHDHRSMGTDALSHCWKNLGPVYACPPPILIGRILQKIRAERLESVALVAPVWLAQTWWPTLITMMRSPPLTMPNESWVTTDQMGNETWPCRWPLAAWHLSGSSQLANRSRQQHWTSAGPLTRTDVLSNMTSILRRSGSGSLPPTPMVNSVLQAFDRV
jgi:hypothetical protein